MAPTSDASWPTRFRDITRTCGFLLSTRYEAGLTRSIRPPDTGASYAGGSEHCCSTMRDQVEFRCNEHADRFVCPDALISYDVRFNEYGLIVHDGGTASLSVSFCPWCGTRLPQSERDRWFDALEDLGIDPWADRIPSKYRDGRWRSRT
jgi:hypothetical protein